MQCYHLAWLLPLLYFSLRALCPTFWARLDPGADNLPVSPQLQPSLAQDPPNLVMPSPDWRLASITFLPIGSSSHLKWDFLLRQKRGKPFRVSRQREKEGGRAAQSVWASGQAKCTSDWHLAAATPERIRLDLLAWMTGWLLIWDSDLSFWSDLTPMAPQNIVATLLSAHLETTWNSQTAQALLGRSLPGWLF